MKILKYMVAMIAIAFATNAYAADFDALLQANFKARGGKTPAQIKTLMMDTEAQAMGTSIPMTFYAKGADKYVILADIMGEKMKVLKDEKGTSVIGGGQSETLPEGQAALVAMQFPQALFFVGNPLATPASCTAENTTLTKKEFKDKEYDVIAVKVSKAVSYEFYIDPATKLEVGVGIVLHKSGDAELDAQVDQLNLLNPVFEVSDWKEVSGIKFPMKYELSIMGNKQTLVVKSVEVDGKIDESAFKN